MANHDWEKFGEDIKKVVQDAIDSQDFDKLNQTITNTITNAADAIAKNMKNTGNKSGYRQEYGPDCSQAYSPRYQERKEQQVYDTRKSRPGLYRGTGYTRAGGLALAITGITMGVVFLIPLLVFLVGAASAGGYAATFRILSVVFFLLATGSFVMGGCGVSMVGRVKRFREYVSILAGREYCNIKELAEKSHQSVKAVVKDLNRMIVKKWFTQGYLDEQKTCLITSREMYDQYLQIQTNRKKMEQEENARREEGAERKAQINKLPPQVQKIIDAGDEYIDKIRSCNDAIPGKEISAKISRMELLVDKIFDRVEQNPECVDDIRKLMDYYLPTTIKLLNAYEELDAQPVDGENIRASKAEIEATLDTLNVAFEKLLDSLFQDTAWDVSSDISVLNTMLAQEGLTEDGMRR